MDIGACTLFYMTVDAEQSTIKDLAQSISNRLTDLAYWVRLSPGEARELVGTSESITSDLKRLYGLVGEP